MKLPWPAKAIVIAAGAAGALIASLAATSLPGHWSPDAPEIAVLVAFWVLWVIAWVWPLVMYRKDQSEAMHLDEGFFVVLALLFPPAAVVLAIGAATFMAQIIKRRALVKAVFNSGEMLLSVAAGLAAFRLIGQPGRPITALDLLAAVIGVSVLFLVNTAAVACIMGVTGTPWRSALLDGLEMRLLVTGGGVAIALPTALVLSAYSWALPLTVLPLVLLRQVLAGHFEARRDRSRLQGLLQSTLEINGSVSATTETTAAILGSARRLLRCGEAELNPAQVASGSVQTTMHVANSGVVLSVGGRNRAEPFDHADRALLEALAMVGSTSLRNAELHQESRRQREWLGAITSSLGEGVCAVDEVGRLTFVNPAAARMLGWDQRSGLSYDEVEGPSVLSQPPSSILAHAARAMTKLETTTNYDTRLTALDGTTVPVAVTVAPVIDGGKATGAVLVFRNNTERKRLEEELAHHAFHDALTGLPNRRLFLDHLDHAIFRSQRSAEQHAVLFVDIDRFKMINDSLGHQSGDQLLVAVAERLEAAVPGGNVLARFGGDEFTVLLEGINSPEDSIACAQRVLDNMSEPVRLVQGHEVLSSVSIGVALTGAGKSGDDVLRDADVAMYQAKFKGRGGCYEVFDVQAMGVRSAERIELESGLRKALAAGELVVHYQPVVDLVEGDVVGAEALVRWNHPRRGILYPASFIGVAEDTGLILPLGRQVLERCCLQAREWRDRFGVALDVSVNLSARQFRQSNLFEQVDTILRETEVDPAQINLEITETVAMEDTDRTRLVLERLKGLGVKLSIDDFGTGYSALGYLAEFPVDLVKVDRAFVEGIDLDPVKSAIVSAVVRLSEAIGTTVVVEGIETASQLGHLRSIGCRLGQGFFFARPMPARKFSSILRRTKHLQGEHEGGPGASTFPKPAAAVSG